MRSDQDHRRNESSTAEVLNGCDNLYFFLSESALFVQAFFARKGSVCWPHVSRSAPNEVNAIGPSDLLAVTLMRERRR